MRYLGISILASALFCLPLGCGSTTSQTAKITTETKDSKEAKPAPSVALTTETTTAEVDVPIRIKATVTGSTAKVLWDADAEPNTMPKTSKQHCKIVDVGPNSQFAVFVADKPGTYRITAQPSDADFSAAGHTVIVITAKMINKIDRPKSTFVVIDDRHEPRAVKSDREWSSLKDKYNIALLDCDCVAFSAFRRDISHDGIPLLIHIDLDSGKKLHSRRVADPKALSELLAVWSTSHESVRP
jgi:hypothetical protein